MIRNYAFFYSIVACGLVLLFPDAVDAGLLDNGPITLDTETGIEYLDMAYTGGTFPNQYIFPDTVTPRRPLPAQFSDFRPATRQEALSLFSAVGLAPDIKALSAYISADTLHTFMGRLYAFDNSGFINGITYGRTEHRTVMVTGTPAPAGGLKYYAYLVRTDVDYNETPDEYLGWLIEEDFNIAGASADTGTLMVRNKPNASPNNPVSESNSGVGFQAFVGIDEDGIWVDVNQSLLGGWKLTASDPSLITAVGISSSFTDSDNKLQVNDPILGLIDLLPGEVVTLSAPVSMIEIFGYEPLLGIAEVSSFDQATPADVQGVPLFVALDNSGDLTVTNVPEPASISIMALTGAVLLRRFRASKA